MSIKNSLSTLSLKLGGELRVSFRGLQIFEDLNHRPRIVTPPPALKEGYKSANLKDEMVQSYNMKMVEG